MNEDDVEKLRCMRNNKVLYFFNCTKYSQLYLLFLIDIKVDFWASKLCFHPSFWKNFSYIQTYYNHSPVVWSRWKSISYIKFLFKAHTFMTHTIQDNKGAQLFKNKACATLLAAISPSWFCSEICNWHFTFCPYTCYCYLLQLLLNLVYYNLKKNSAHLEKKI